MVESTVILRVRICVVGETTLWTESPADATRGAPAVIKKRKPAVTMAVALRWVFISDLEFGFTCQLTIISSDDGQSGNDSGPEVGFWAVVDHSSI